MSSRQNVKVVLFCSFCLNFVISRNLTFPEKKSGINLKRENPRLAPKHSYFVRMSSSSLIPCTVCSKNTPDCVWWAIEAEGTRSGIENSEFWKIKEIFFLMGTKLPIFVKKWLRKMRLKIPNLMSLPSWEEDYVVL